MSAAACRKRGAFTLLECAIALIVVVLFLAILVSAVVRLRDNGSNRARAMNNLRQIGLATANFAAAYADELPGLTDGGVWYELLPYIESGSPFDLFVQEGGHVNPRRDVSEHGPGIVMSVYLDPADGTGGSRRVNHEADGSEWAGTSFYPNPAVFSSVDEARRFADITDGRSQTIMYAGRVVSCRGRFNAWFRGGNSSKLSTHLLSREGFGTPPPADNYGVLWSSGCDPGASSTPYRKVTLIGMADVRVLALTPDVASAVWSRICTPDGQDFMSVGWDGWDD